jgi:hypothetical protein
MAAQLSSATRRAICQLMDAIVSGLVLHEIVDGATTPSSGVFFNPQFLLFFFSRSLMAIRDPIFVFSVFLNRSLITHHYHALFMALHFSRGLFLVDYRIWRKRYHVRTLLSDFFWIIQLAFGVR